MQKYYRSLIRIFLGLILTTFTNFCIAAVNYDSTNDQTNFLVLSDIHLDSRPTTPPMQINPYSSSWNNDLDLHTFHILLQTIKDAIPTPIQQPAFILITGDIAGYDRTNYDEIYNDERDAFAEINHAFPHIPILMVFGNNDSIEKDYGMFYYPPGVSGKANSRSPYEIAISSGWADGFLSTGNQCLFSSTYPCIITENNTAGYYSAYLKSHLRLLALNSVMFSASHHNTSPQSIATIQLDWLEQQLITASLKGDSVLIAAHIPFGNNIYDHSAFWRTVDQERFYNLLSRYKNIIIGVLSGHTHMEELKVLQDSANNDVGALVFTAALSTSHGNASSVKSFSLNKNNQKWSIADYETFYFLHDPTNLQKCYDYTGYYCDTNSQNIFECLKNVNITKLFPKYSACNPNYSGTISSPDDIFVTLPDTSNSVVTNNNGNNSNSNGIYGVLGAAAAAGVGALIIGTANSGP